MVKSVGEAVTLFSPGDEVWYAGALGRAGSNSEFQLVDERITALKPKTLDNASAAALPLTAITAWEMLFDRLGVEENGNEDDVLLIVGAAGGVGSILTQLASKLTKMIVIGTASRPQSQKWVREAGAHHVIDHSKPLTEELARIGIKEVTHVASLNNTEQHYSQIIAALAPQGKLALIDDPQTLDARPAEGQKHFAALGVYVYPFDVYHPRHHCAASVTDPCGAADRQQHPPYHAGRTFWRDYRGKSAKSPHTN